MKVLARILAVVIAALLWAGPGFACSCERGSPSAGFDRAQYVFTGTVVEGRAHTWVVEVDRVWKGREKLGHSVRLMDVYAQMDCEFYFEQGKRYLFFVIKAKSGRDVFYHPQVCNWTSPLRSTRVPTKQGDTVWIEDLIDREHGPGEPPRDERDGGSRSSGHRRSD
jgi:hypothetical protein